VHFEKNRFIFDLMYKQQALSRELVRAARPSACAGEGSAHGCTRLRALPPLAGGRWVLTRRPV